MIAAFHIGEWTGAAVATAGLLGAIWRGAVKVSRLLETNIAQIAANTRENKAIASQVAEVISEQERVKTVLEARVLPKVEAIQKTVDGHTDA